ncbi:MAG: RHS repeat domain-containing protein [Nitrospiraceae bacterium]
MLANISKNIVMTSKTALHRAMYMVVLTGALIVNVGSLAADQAQYYYDELGRLVGVANEQGDTAVYTYDAVGNLLSI